MTFDSVEQLIQWEAPRWSSTVSSFIMAATTICTNIDILGSTVSLLKVSSSIFAACSLVEDLPITKTTAATLNNCNGNSGNLAPQVHKSLGSGYGHLDG